MLGEFKERAEWHLGSCEVIKRCICDPLVAFKEQQRKEVKSHQAGVEKALKSLMEINALAAKVRILYLPRKKMKRVI